MSDRQSVLSCRPVNQAPSFVMITYCWFVPVGPVNVLHLASLIADLTLGAQYTYGFQGCRQADSMPFHGAAGCGLVMQEVQMPTVGPLD